ncbi:hypothetical protein ACHWQZ_G003819 [Mnemiopsis leidyi]
MNFGVLTAFGQQRFAAKITGISCCLSGLPIVILRIFLTDLGLVGIIIGWIASDIIILVATVVKISGLDIGKEVEESRLRVTESNSIYGSVDATDRTAFENLASQARMAGEVKLGAVLGCTKQDSHGGKLIVGDDSSRTRSEYRVNQEAKTILGLFVVFGLMCGDLASISVL